MVHLAHVFFINLLLTQKAVGILKVYFYKLFVKVIPTGWNKDKMKVNMTNVYA